MCEIKGREFEYRLESRGCALLMCLIQGRNDYLIPPGFNWFYNLDRFAISMKFNNLHKPMVKIEIMSELCDQLFGMPLCLKINFVMMKRIWDKNLFYNTNPFSNYKSP